MLVLAGLVRRRVTLCCATRTNFAYYDEVLRYQPISVSTRSSGTLVYKNTNTIQLHTTVYYSTEFRVNACSNLVQCKIHLGDQQEERLVLPEQRTTFDTNLNKNVNVCFLDI